MVRPELSEPGTELAMDILGERHPVTVIPELPYDPDNHRLRGWVGRTGSIRLMRNIFLLP